MKQVEIRQGDVAFFSIDKLPDGLVKSESKVFMQGSGGNDNSYDHGEWYPKTVGDFIIGYFVAHANTKLLHIEHGKPCGKGELKIIEPPALVYEVHRQNEETHSGMRPVID